MDLHDDVENKSDMVDTPLTKEEEHVEEKVKMSVEISWDHYENMSEEENHETNDIIQDYLMDQSMEEGESMNEEEEERDEESMEEEEEESSEASSESDNEESMETKLSQLAIKNPWIDPTNLPWSLKVLKMSLAQRDMESIQNLAIVKFSQQCYVLTEAIYQSRQNPQSSSELTCDHILSTTITFLNELEGITHQHKLLLAQIFELLELSLDEAFERCTGKMEEIHLFDVFGTILVESCGIDDKKKKKNGPPRSMLGMAFRIGQLKNIQERIIDRIQFFLLTHSTKPVIAQSVIRDMDSMTALLGEEMQNKYLDLRTTDADESHRSNLALKIERTIRKNRIWRNHRLEIFGSSKSLFGSKDCDLDMCLVSPQEGKNAIRQFDREVLEVKTQRDEHRAQPGVNICLLENFVKQEVHRLLREVDKSEQKYVNFISATKEVAQRESTSQEGDGQDTGQDKERKSSSELDLNRRDTLKSNYHLSKFFLAKYQSFQLILLETVAQLKATPTTGSSFSLYRRLDRRYCDLMRDVQRERKVMYVIGHALKHLPDVRGSPQVLCHARVPIVKFAIMNLHHPSELQCDICVDNTLALENTELLRTYGQCDERARVLGYVVKHWAKQRGINDASSGTLSSYSYIVLVIHFLQQQHVLPNLQDPTLVLHMPEKILMGYDVRFCRNLNLARKSLLDSTTTTTTTPALLLVKFFHYYVHEFNFFQDVVSIKSLERVSKLCRWTKSNGGGGGAHTNKFGPKYWRMSLEDPFERERDLGCVLSWKGQKTIMEELKRALEMLSKGESLDALCRPCEKVQAANGVKEERRNKDDTKRKNRRKTPKKYEEDKPRFNKQRQGKGQGKFKPQHKQTDNGRWTEKM